MLSFITRLVPHAGSFDTALDAFRAARFRACLAELRDEASPAASALRARCHLRLGHADAALRSLTYATCDGDGHRAELALIRGAAHARLGNDAPARNAFVEACVYAISSQDATLESEVDFYRALAAFGDARLDDARSSCARALATASSVTTIETSSTIPHGHVFARVLELRGLIDAAEGDYAGWLTNARDALAAHDESGVPDVYSEAILLKNLAVIARDFDVESIADELAVRVPAVAWTDEIAHLEFSTVEILGWCRAIRGDALGSLRLFRRAESVAAVDAERILIGVDRAIVMREFGRSPVFIEEVENALEGAARYDWEHAPGDYRTILLALAQVAASVDPRAARKMLDRYASLRGGMDRTYVARLEPRLRAEEDYAHGIVLRAEQRNVAAIDRLRRAFDVWEAIGYRWRAARAALELAELGAGATFRLALRRELHVRPDSIFAARARIVA